MILDELWISRNLTLLQQWWTISLKVLTHKFEVEIVLRYAKVATVVPPILAGSLLLLLIGFLLWLPPSQRFSSASLGFSHSPISTFSAIFPCSWQFSKLWKSLGARKNHQELGYKCAEKHWEGGSHKRIQSVEEGGSPLKSARAWKDYQSQRSFFGNIFLRYVLGVL